MQNAESSSKPDGGWINQDQNSARPLIQDVRENRLLASEIKFLLEPDLASHVLRWARARLAPDPNAIVVDDGYEISSLYFDNSDWDVFGLRGSFGRSKFRVRRYGESGLVFLERKLRTKRLLAKRRSLIAMRDLERLAAGKALRGWPGFWFHRRLLRRGLRPVCQVSYRRMALVGRRSCGPIRLTLDQHLRAAPADDLSFEGRAPVPVAPDKAVLELKFLGDTPALFKYLVSEFALEPRKFSKYRVAVARLGLCRAVTASAAHLG